MALEFRQARADEWAALQDIWTVVYRSGSAPAEQPEPVSFCSYYIGYLDSKPVFACQVDEYQVMRGGHGPIRCAGIAMVGTLPEARHLGVATKCLNRLMAILAEDGFVLSALYAFKDSYYRRFGYETCGWRWLIQAPVSCIPDFKQELEPIVVLPDQVMDLSPCHSAFARSMSGTSLRSPAHWAKRLGRKPMRIQAVRSSEGIEGYFWAYAEGFWGKLDVGELVWSTPRGYRSTLALIRSLAINQNSVQWCEPPDSPFLTSYFDYGAEMSRHRASMFRVLDVKSMLELMGPPPEPYSFQITDNLLPTNDGVWSVQKDGRAEKRDEAIPVATCDISAFAMAAMGEPSITDLVKQGRIALNGDASAFVEHLPREQVCLLEFF